MQRVEKERSAQASHQEQQDEQKLIDLQYFFQEQEENQMH
jgi:hypothetical protein